MLKYPFRRAAGYKKFLYDEDVGTAGDEASLGEWMFADSGHALLVEPDPHPPRTLPCQLMDWADDVAYSVHDLEDGIASGLLRPSTWAQEGVIETIYDSVCQAPIKWKDGPPDRAFVEKILQELAKDLRKWEPIIPHEDAHA